MQPLLAKTGSIITLRNGVEGGAGVGVEHAAHECVAATVPAGKHKGARPRRRAGSARDAAGDDLSARGASSPRGPHGTSGDP